MPEDPGTIELSGITYEVHPATWGELGVGMMIIDKNKRPWSIIAAAQPEQFQYAKTCWLKLKARNGDEASLPPRMINYPVNVLVDPANPVAVEPAWPDGAREAWMLAQQLGATEIATQDLRTGEVWCPDYTRPNPERTGFTPLLNHLEICHGVDVTGMDTWESLAVHNAHSRAHTNPIGGTGFTHRHVPEDHDII
jgi:hypothetical protein